MKNRINWDTYFFNVVNDIALRSTCVSRQVGSILVKDKRILATGYNGTVINAKHCSDYSDQNIYENCRRKTLKVKSGTRAEICKGVHAEQNVIIQCAKYGIALQNSIMYVTCSPCSICFKMIVNCEIVAVKFLEWYPDILLEEIAHDAGYLIYKEECLIVRNDYKLQIRNKIKGNKR
jgi:dCMP deaminase